MIAIASRPNQENGGGGNYTTMMTGEEGGTSGQITTYSGGREDGGVIDTGHATTLAVGEEGGGIATTLALGEEGGGVGYQPDETMDTFTGITFVQYADTNHDGMMTRTELTNFQNQLSRYQSYLNYNPNNSSYTNALKYFISEQIKAGNFMKKYFDKFDQAGNRPNGTINVGDIFTVAARDGNVREVSANNDNLRNTFVQFPPLVNGLFIQPPQVAVTAAYPEGGQAPPEQVVTMAYPESGQAL